jgi:hypothetical protein
MFFSKKVILCALILWESSSLRADSSLLPNLNERTDVEEQEPGRLKKWLFKYFFETRPTWDPTNHAYWIENTLEFGFKWHERHRLSYVQSIISKTYRYKENENFLKKPILLYQDAYLRWKIKEIWKNETSKLSMALQHRLYLPVASATSRAPSRIDQGMIFITRHYLGLRYKALSFMDLSLSYAPSFFIFKKDGYEHQHKSVANPIFEHLWVQTTSFDFTKTLHFYIPLSFRMTKTRDYGEGAENNTQWLYTFYTLPQLDWWISKTQTLGLAFVSDNFIQPDGKKTTWKSGYEKGQFQILWNIRLKHESI